MSTPAVLCPHDRPQRRLLPSISRGPLPALVALVVICVARPATAQEFSDGRSIAAWRLPPGQTLVVDGRLDEEAWREADAATDFLQQEPEEGAAPTEWTEVRVAYDADHLYIGALLHDSQPDGVIGHQRQRDTGLGSDDRFMWILDTFLDGRSAYFFEINPAGLMGDGLLRIGSGDQLNKAWDGIWEARVARGEYGWSAEVRIPFRTLNFSRELETWGINFQRTVRRKNEETLWSGHRRNQGLFQPIHAGRLTGLQRLSQGIGLEAKPYVSVSGRGGPVSVGDGTSGDVGFDVTYSLTANLRAALTINTDFAETEVDDRRVNLTRFPLQFPERRQFFLEGSSVYQFAQASSPEPYFSRRIGLDEAGQPIPIRYGARLGGRAGAFDVGFLQIATGRSGAHAPEQFTVARVKRALFAQSSIGTIYTRRASDEEGGLEDRHTLGVDLDLFTSRFLGDKNLQFEAFYVWHNDPLLAGTTTAADRSTRGIRLDYPNDIWRMHVSYREFGDAYDPAVGFVERRGFRRLQPTVTWAPRPSRYPSIRQLEFGARLEHLTDFDNDLLTQNVDFTLFGAELQTGDRMTFSTGFRFERLRDEFNIYRDIVLPTDEYRVQDWQLEASTARRRPVSAEIRLVRGGFWSGDRTAYEMSVTVRPLVGVSLDTEWEREAVRLAEGDFTTDLVRLGANWHLSPWASLIGTVQYDTVSEVVGLFSRVRWIIRPGSDLFLVYTHNWDDVSGRLRTLSRQGAAKINYTHRF